MGTSIQFGRVHGDDRFYNAAKARRNPHHYPFRPRSSASSSSGAGSSAASTVSNGREPENRTGSEPQSKATAVLSSPSGPVAPSRCNLDRFLESTVPSVPAQYLSKVSPALQFFFKKTFLSFSFERFYLDFRVFFSLIHWWTDRLG